MVFPRTNENIQTVTEACTVLLREQQSWFVTHTKKLEKVYFVDEEFLHKKQKWRLYEDYSVLKKIFQKTW